MNKKKKKRVVLAMSSGVDSSVAAALLKNQGYEVVGIFMHFWKESVDSELVENKCCSLEAYEDARRVAGILDIPLYTINAEKEFKREVVDYFIDEYKSGRTPNPCVACNPKIKFKILFEKMLEMKADFVASGHYARITQNVTRNTQQKEKFGKEIYKLFQGADKEKDQSYFLYNLTQKQLSRIIFPIGKYEKTEIRKLAKEYSLPVFDKEESQGICFTKEKYPAEFLKRNIQMKAGEIVDTQGNKIGSHEGLALYTIGQRRGINIGGNGPYYVVDKNLNSNKLIVTNDEKDPRLRKKEMVIENVNWILGEPKLPHRAQVKIRYRKPEVYATIKAKRKEKGREVFDVEFDQAQQSVAPGQSAVFYTEKGEVIGGGVIKS